MIALLLPAVQAAREAARRAQCTNNLKQIGLALHNYAQALHAFPPGCIVNMYDGSPEKLEPWEEASSDSRGRLHGTSWMLMILPYLEQQNLYDRWNFQTNVLGNAEVADDDIPGFYCPTRRSKLRPEDVATPRAGMIGALDRRRHRLRRLSGGHQRLGQHLHRAQSQVHQDRRDRALLELSGRRATTPSLIGIFRPNVAAKFADIKDGTSNTIMTGEMQRLDASTDATSSQDGWALGGVATLFSTANAVDGGAAGGLNNNFFQSAGSDHAGGAHFGIADGSVQFISENVDSNLFDRLGSMADGRPESLP